MNAGKSAKKIDVKDADSILIARFSVAKYINTPNKPHNTNLPMSFLSILISCFVNFKVKNKTTEAIENLKKAKEKGVNHCKQILVLMNEKPQKRLTDNINKYDFKVFFIKNVLSYVMSILILKFYKSCTILKKAKINKSKLST